TEPRREAIIYPGRNPIFFNPYISKDDSVLSVGRLVDAGKQVFLLTQHAHPFPVCIVGAEQTVPVPRIPIRADVKVATAEASVAIRGPQTEAQLRSLYSRAAVYAATPRYEPLGMAPLDAAFSRCAIVANDFPVSAKSGVMPPSISAPTMPAAWPQFSASWMPTGLCARPMPTAPLPALANASPPSA